MIDYRKIALKVSEEEKRRAPYMRPPMTYILVSWRRKTYLGGFQEIVPEFSSEIVYFSKTTKPISEELGKSILELDLLRPVLTADSEIDLGGPSHVLRRVGIHLIRLTPEQTQYVAAHPPSVIGI